MTGPDDHTIVFVGGLHRSGTTLVARLLAEHPDASGFAGTGVPEDEGQHLQDVLPVAGLIGGAGRFAFSRDAHLTEASPLANPMAGDALWRSWSAHWDLSREVLVEKSPPNIVRARLLQALFGESARFVMVIRHPVAVTCATENWVESHRRSPAALQRGPLAWTKAGRLVRHWLRAHELLEADALHVHNLLVVRYEQLVADPVAAAIRLQEFAGLTPAPPESEVRRGIDDKYFDRWQARRGDPLRRLYVAAIARRYEPRVARFGYSLSPPWRSRGNALPQRGLAMPEVAR